MQVTIPGVALRPGAHGGRHCVTLQDSACSSPNYLNSQHHLWV